MKKLFFMILILAINIGTVFGATNLKGKNFNINVLKEPDKIETAEFDSQAGKIKTWTYRWQEEDRSIIIAYSLLPKSLVSSLMLEGVCEDFIVETILNPILNAGRSVTPMKIENIEEIGMGVKGIDIYCLLNDDRLGVSFCRFRLIMCKNEVWTIFSISPDHNKINELKEMYNSLRVYPGIII